MVRGSSTQSRLVRLPWPYDPTNKASMPVPGKCRRDLRHMPFNQKSAQPSRRSATELDLAELRSSLAVAEARHDSILKALDIDRRLDRIEARKSRSKPRPN
jgi:hypothetical protein